MSDAPLQHTSLYELHFELGAKMVPFAGYAMPVSYPAGILAERATLWSDLQVLARTLRLLGSS